MSLEKSALTEQYRLGFFSGPDIRYALAERSHRQSACKGRNGGE